MTLATAIFGCGDRGARQYAVTVSDSVDIDCEGVTTSDYVDQDTVDVLAKDVRKSWKAARLADPPTPHGRTLFVNELDERMQAWFEKRAAYEPASGAEQFESPDTVYRGGAHDGYVEGTFDDVINTDQQDELLARELCGNRLRATGVLSLTEGSSLQGRVRWTDTIWIDTVETACAGKVDCVRNIGVEGLELE